VSGFRHPQTVDGTKAAAQTVFDRFSGGDVAGAWALEPRCAVTASTAAQPGGITRTPGQRSAGR
jgi:hypothetical protein